MSEPPLEDASPGAGQPDPATRVPVVEERLHPLTPVVRLWIGVVATAWFGTP